MVYSGKIFKSFSWNDYKVVTQWWRIIAIKKNLEKLFIPVNQIKYHG